MPVAEGVQPTATLDAIMARYCGSSLNEAAWEEGIGALLIISTLNRRSIKQPVETWAYKKPRSTQTTLLWSFVLN